MVIISLHRLSHTTSKEVEDRCSHNTREVLLIKVCPAEAELNILDVHCHHKQTEYQVRKITGIIELNLVLGEAPMISMMIVRRMRSKIWTMDMNMVRKITIIIMKMTIIEIILKNPLDNRCMVNLSSSNNIITMIIERLIELDRLVVIRQTSHLRAIRT